MKPKTRQQSPWKSLWRNVLTKYSLIVTLKYMQVAPIIIERYYRAMTQMDPDTEINAALDTIAEFSTQNDPKTGVPFKIFYKDKPN